jgi:Neuraminidase (sialidase)
VLISTLVLTIVYLKDINIAFQPEPGSELIIEEPRNNKKMLPQQSKNKENTNSKALIQQDNNSVDIPLSRSVFKCFPMTEIQKQVSLDVLEKFANENVLHPSAVDQYLTRLDEEELVSEFEAGNASAAYVLGMNLFFSSHNTSSYNPNLRVELSVDNNQGTYLNLEKLNEARKWLLIAATNGISISLGELAGTYSVEYAFMKSDYKRGNVQSDSLVIINRLNMLKAKQFSYNLLFVEAAPQANDLFGGGQEYYENEFERLLLEDKEKVFTKIKTQWVADRFNIGQSSEIELKVPNEIKIALRKYQNSCIK